MGGIDLSMMGGYFFKMFSERRTSPVNRATGLPITVARLPIQSIKWSQRSEGHCQ